MDAAEAADKRDRAPAIDADGRPAPAPRDARRRTLWACIIASAVVFIDGTVVNVALPALSRDLDAGLAAGQWIVDAYLLVLSALLVVGGSVGDVYGRRRAFRAGLALFGVTSTLVGLAPSVPVLVAARALQGAAGALLVPGSLALLRTAYPGDEERGAAVGTWTAWSAGATAVGPLLGGLLVDQASWRLVFVVNVPVLAGAFVLARAVPETRVGPSRRIDLVGAAVGVLALGLPVAALIELPRRGVADPLVWAPAAVGLLLVPPFLRHEARAPDPMLPLRLFARRAFAVVNLYTLLLYGGFGSALLFTSLYVQGSLGYSALAAGAVSLPVTLSLILLSRRAGTLAARLGARPLLAAGGLMAGVGLAVMAAGGPGTLATRLLPGGLVLGVGAAAAVAPLTTTLLAAVPEHDAGIASGVNNAASRVAMLLAVAAIGAAAAAAFTVPAARGGADAGVVRAARDQPFAAPAADASAPVAAGVRRGSRRAFRVALGLAAAEAALAGVVALALPPRERRGRGLRGG